METVNYSDADIIRSVAMNYDIPSVSIVYAMYHRLQQIANRLEESEVELKDAYSEERTVELYAQWESDAKQRVEELEEIVKSIK